MKHHLPLDLSNSCYDSLSLNSPAADGDLLLIDSWLLTLTVWACLLQGLFWFFAFIGKSTAEGA